MANSESESAPKSLMDLPSVKNWMKEKEDEIAKRRSLSQMIEDMIEMNEAEAEAEDVPLLSRPDTDDPSTEVEEGTPVEDNTGLPQTREEQLQARINYWQERLLLHDWQVWGDFRDDNEGSYADINYDIYHFQATILMPRGMPVEHWDWGIVHELLHLRLSPICRLAEKAMAANDKREAGVLDMFTDDHIEPVINRLTDAFVGSKRPRLPK